MYLKIEKRKKFNYILLILSFILSIITAAVVFYTGGTAKVYAHLMYIPITIASSTNSKTTGIIHAAFSAMLVGPFMPLDSFLNIAQEPINWIIRAIIYITISIIIGLFHDYNKKYQAYITNILTHDPVTKLNNIQALKKVEIAENDKIVIAFSVKSYNEMVSVFGYDFIGKVILQFSKMLRTTLEDFKNIELYKHEGMNFILVLSHECQTDILDNCPEKLLKEIDNLNSNSIIVEDIPIYIEISLGMSNVKKGESLLEGVRHSLIALEYANFKNYKYYVYDKFLDNHYNKILKIASGFREALANNNIKIASQNIYSSYSGEIYGVELLARWILNDGSRIYNDEFIPVIEKTELIKELTKHMVNNAIEGIVKGYFKNTVSINLSVMDFNSEIVDYIISKVQSNSIEKGRLQIEITESHFIDKEVAAEYLMRLNKNGVNIAIDDFGTGYSSYQYISELPINVVKIDKSLIEKIGNNTISKNAVQSIVNFCKIHNFSTVAEGVETKEIAEACKDIGIDYLQGYYFHKPTII